MLLRQGGAHGGHRVVKARLVQGDHVDVPLHQDEVGPPGFLGVVQPVEDGAFLEDRRLRRIQIFGRGVVHHPAGEADHVPPGVNDGQHQAVAVLVVHAAPLARHRQPGLDEVGLVVPLAPHGLDQAVPGVRSRPQAEPGGKFGADPPLVPDIGCHRRPPGVGQHGAVEPGGLPVQLQNPLAPLPPPPVPAGVLRHGQARLIRQLPHRVREGQALHLHEEPGGAAPLAAAEAVEDLPGLVDGEGGGLFVVEGAQAPVVPPPLGQGHVGGYHVHNIEPAVQIVQKGIWYGHGPTSAS